MPKGKSKRKYGPQDLPKELAIFWNDATSEPFLMICDSDSDAFVEAADEDKIVGIYRLERRVRLRFSVKREEV